METQAGAMNPTAIPVYAFSGFVGNDFNDHIDLSTYIPGILVSVRAANLPDGISCHIYEDQIRFDGSPTATCSNHTSLITAVDDTG